MSIIEIIEWYDDIIKVIIDIDSKNYIFTLVFKNGNIKTYFGIPISEFIESNKIIQLLNNGITKENYTLFLQLLKKVNSNNNPLLIITEDLTSENLTPIKFKKDNKWLNDFFDIEYPIILEKASKYKNWDIY